MKLLILLALVGFVACQKGKNPPAPKAGAAKPAARAAAPRSAAKPAAKASSSGGDKKYVWDFLKPALDAAEVAAILKSGGDYPTLAEVPADSAAFDCSSKKQPGFYADVATKCQVFHRCDVNGNLTSYLCVNTTVFNQITLTCDYFFNVDCEKFAEQEDFANSRLYKEDQPLFDTPPEDYVPPQREPRKMGEGETGNEVGPSPTTKKGAATTKKAGATTKKGGATTKATTAAPEETTAAAGDEETTAAGGEDTTAAGGEDTTAAAGGEETTAAAEGGEETTAAAGGEETTAAAEGEETTAAAEGGEETTAAAGGEETTAAAEGEETTAAAGGEETTAAAE